MTSYLHYRKFIEKLQKTIQPATFSYVFMSSAQKGNRAWTWLTVDTPNHDDYFVVMEYGGNISRFLVDDGCVKIVGQDGMIDWAVMEEELHRYGKVLENFDTDCIPDIIDVMREWCRKHPVPGRPRTSEN